MATIVDEGFEAGLGAYSTSGTPPTTGAAAAHTGSNGLIVTTVGGTASQIVRTLPAGTQEHVFRFYYKVVQDTSGSASIYQADCASGTFVIQARVGRKLRIYVGGTTGVDSTTVLNLNQWYLIDGRFVSSGTTATGDMRIDTLPLTQVTRAQAAADQTAVRVGNTATNIYVIHVDDWKLTNVSADYPLGALPGNSASAVTATGTGVANAGGKTTGISAGRPTGTGLTWGALTAELVVAATNAPGQAFAISNDTESRVTPAPAVAAGTGSVPSTGRTSTASVSTASGTGAATAAVIKNASAPETASGLGSAYQTVSSTTMTATSGQAAGTGAAANAAPTAVGGSHAPGLTIQMGM